MPADRSRGSKRHASDGSQLTWTTPVEAASPQGIAFAQTITPFTYNDPPTPISDDGSYISDNSLFPPSSDCSAKKPAHSKKKPENHIPRPPNAFILFRSSFIKSQHVSTEVETNHSTLSKIIGLTWSNLPQEERQVWHAKAKAALEEHKRRFPSYAFRPSHTRGKGGGTEKRKVREVGPKDVKRCEKIASLLVEGKKGDELEAAIQEFDRTHVPEVITRFEAPITARAYRRSSSAPAPDVEQLKPFLRASSTTRSTKRVRAASSQPTRASTPLPLPSDLGPENFYNATMSTGFSNAEFTFAPKAEPSFDFNPFFYEEAQSPYAPPTPASGDHSFDMYQADMSHRELPPALSINTSFNHEWTNPSPFSTSPSTPQMYSQQSSPSTADIDETFSMQNFDIDSFDHTAAFDRPLDMQGGAFMSPAFDTLAKDASHFGTLGTSKPQLAGQDLDFSSFMSSLQYTA